MLSDEMQAAVNLGYISQKSAENVYKRLNITQVNRDDVLQRKSFLAGYLFMNFKFKWDILDSDMDQAKSAWNEWCDHIEKTEI